MSNERKYMTREEVISLEAYLEARLGADLRNCLMFLTILKSGLRPGELIGIEWSDVNLKTGEIYIRTKKLGKPRPALIDDRLVKHFERLLQISPVKPFNICYGRLHELWGEYRNVTLPLKSARHAFAQHAFAKTKDPRMVQKFMGHRSMTSTLVYLEYDYTSADLRKAMS